MDVNISIKKKCCDDYCNTNSISYCLCFLTSVQSVALLSCFFFFFMLLFKASYYLNFVAYMLALCLCCLDNLLFLVILIKLAFCDQQETLFHLQLLPQPQLPPPPPAQPLGPPPHSSVTTTSMCMLWQAWLHTSI